MVDGRYEPKEILDYKNLDLRITDRVLTYYDQGNAQILDDRKFIRKIYRRSKLQALLKYYVFYSFAINNWAQFTETFGKPMRKGTYKQTANAKDVEVLKAAIKAAGTDQACIISETCAIEFVDFAGKADSKDLYKTLCEFVESRETKRILGQTMTTDQTKYGTQALGAVQNEVRKDIMDGDLRDLTSFVTEILRRYELFNFGTQDLQLFLEVHDAVNLSERMTIDEKAIRLGLPVALKYMYETYGIDEPAKGEALIVVPQAAVPFPNAHGSGRQANARFNYELRITNYKPKRRF
jgi:phage gp29-like protein